MGIRNRNRHDSNVQEYPISRLHVHSRYIIRQPEDVRDSIDYDIALLKLKTPVSKTTRAGGVLLNEHVAPACLPRLGEFDADSDAVCFVTGWGYTGKQSHLTLFGNVSKTVSKISLLF